MNIVSRSDTVISGVVAVPKNKMLLYADDIYFGRHPVGDRLGHTLCVFDGEKIIAAAILLPGDEDYSFWAEDMTHPKVVDFLNRSDWKSFWGVV